MPYAEHQTFHIREGWLFKGMRAIRIAEEKGELPTIFLDTDAPERLGIGRNMVRSLRFWMQATGLATEHFEGRTVQRLTPFGQMVWNYDSYLESDTTLWLLHYNLACSQDRATSWFWFFNHFAPRTFTSKEVVDSLQQWVTAVETKRSVALSSLKKDVSCLLRTYMPDKRPKSPENLSECPLARLYILSGVSESEKRYLRMRPKMLSLEPLIVLYVTLCRQAESLADTHQVRFTQVLQEPMNAGRVFNLTLAELVDLLERLNRQHPDLHVQIVRTAGLDQITLPRVSPREVLMRCYSEESTKAERVV